ncbi:P-loop containing nucleoside triphosphate hydrolase protein [Aspergillus unguis]
MAIALRNRIHSFFRSPLFNFTTKKHVPTLVFGLIACFVASFSIPLFAIILGEIFNLFSDLGTGKLTSKEVLEKVSNHCIQFLALGAIGWFFHGVYYVLFVVFGELQAANARSRLFEGLLKKDQRFFEQHDEGTRTFLGHLQIQVQELKTATSQSLALVLQYFFRILVSLGLAFYTSWNLTFVILAGIPIVSLIIPFVAPKINASIEAQQHELKTASKVVNNAVLSIDAVKYLNAQDVESKKLSSGVDKATPHYIRQAHFNALQISVMRFMMFAMFVQGFWYGGYLVTSGKLQSGDVIRTFWACSNAAQSIEALMPHLLILEKGKVASTGLINSLNGGAENKNAREMQGGFYPTHCEGDIKVSRLSFSYPSQTDRLSLNSASFLFLGRATTFVIGKSGSGKSTLGQLLTRFYLPTDGDIFIDGNPIQTLGISWIRNNITYVEQRSILFNETIFKNIAFGKRNCEDVHKQDVEECINLAMLPSVIEKLPHGIETLVGEGGNALSGGQRQRVAIARARLRDTPVLILDEPTSALDGANRVQVMNNIRKWREGKTTIIITHDMSHIKDTDFVYVMDQGSVIKAGHKSDLQDDPILSGFFPTVEENTEVSETDSDLSDVSTLSGESYVKPPLPVRNPARISGNSTQSTDSVDALLRKDPFVSEAEIEMDDLARRTKKIRFKGSTKTSKLRRQLRRLKRRQAKAEANNPPLKDPLKRALKSVLPNLTHRQRFFLCIAFLCTLAHAAATPVFSYFLARLMMTLINGTNDSMRWALAVLGIAIGDGFTNYGMYYLLDVCAEAWIDRLRKQAFHNVVYQAKKWFENEMNSAAQLTTTMHASAEEVKNIVARFSQFVLVALAVTLLAVVWSLAISWRLTLVALCCGPIIFAITRGFETTSGIWDKKCGAAKSSVSEVFLETFAEIRTVRSLTLEHYFHLKHLKAASQCLTLGLRKGIYTGAIFGLVESTNTLCTALIFYYGAILVKNSQATVDDITSVNSVLLFSIAYAATVMTWIPQISNSREMAQRLFQLIDLQNDSHEQNGTIQIPKAAPIQFNTLNFRYPSRDASVLKNISFNIPAGSCTAIVGRSGSGKSTIASLLLSLYESPPSVFKPAITLSGVDIRNVHTPTLRSLVSIVPQQPTIFPGTIQENINYGLDPYSPQSTLFNVRSAARAAGIDDFISSLPKGYETVIGDGGIGLSGGQAQRVVIARALVRKPQILVLDEATSALDPNSAELIKQTIKRLVAERSGLTVVIITHAREMMEIADDVVVLEDGRLVEMGPYKALAKRNGGKLRELIEHPDEE